LAPQPRSSQLQGKQDFGRSICAIARSRNFEVLPLYRGAHRDGCAQNVSDFHQDGDEATVRFHLKGSRAKTEGIHFAPADAIAKYIKAAGIESGPPLPPPPRSSQ
jgi:hypothetical protein